MLAKLADLSKKTNKVFEKIMPVFSISGVVLGFLLPGVFINYTFLVPWLVAFMTLTGALKLSARDIGKAASTPVPILLFFLGSRIIMPFLVLILSRLIFRNNPDLVTGFVLLYSVPAAITSFIWVIIFKGDLALALALMLMDTMLAPVLVPGTMRLLLGASVSINITGMVITLLLMAVLPIILGVTLNETSKGKIPAMLDPWLPPIAKFSIIPLIAISSSAASSEVRFDNSDIWIAAIVCIFFGVSGFVIGKLMGFAGKLDKEKQIALIMTNGNKNNNASMTLGVMYFSVTVALPSILAIMFQHILAAVMGRILIRNKE